MSYTLDERNSERQRLLAKVLDPLTRTVLEQINRPQGGRCLDLGCGQGNTTRLLAKTLRPAECLCLEYNADLVSEAAGHPDNPSSVRFVQGDASTLDFPDGSFDVVFARYLLVHLPNPITAIREMLRVAGPRGTVIALDPDCCIQFSYPSSWALDRMAAVWDGLFADALIGRKLFHHFRAAGASRVAAQALLAMEHAGTDIKRCYRLSVEAAEAAIVEKGLLTQSDFAELVRELERLEQDPEAVCFKMPDVAVIASL
jgi:SAM-dependent methyltransferase